MMIATLTLNPTIDAAFAVEAVTHTHKIRTRDEWYVPGGGGITVARMLKRLGTPSTCIYTSGGATGAALDGLVAAEGLTSVRVPIHGPVRIAANVFESRSGCDYRFTPPGPRLTETEWRSSLEVLAETRWDFVVLSGSLPLGVPDDFYAKAIARLGPRGVKVVLDASGDAFSQAIEGGGVYLAKPALSELEGHAGHALEISTMSRRSRWISSPPARLAWSP